MYVHVLDERISMKKWNTWKKGRRERRMENGKEIHVEKRNTCTIFL